MATIDIAAGPSGLERADRMASEADGGGRTAAPAEVGKRSRLTPLQPSLARSDHDRHEPREVTRVPGEAGGLVRGAEATREDASASGASFDNATRAHAMSRVRALSNRARARWENWRRSVWLPLALRAATVGAGMLGLAGIGAASILSGLDGRTPVEVPQKADIHAAWVATQRGPEPGAKAQAHAQDGAERGASELRESAAPSSGAAPDGGAEAGPGITQDGRVILNAASADELTRLPGVGPRKAQSIVELRTRLKRFRRVQDLLRVKGIGPRSLKRLLPHMVLDAPAPAADAGH